jgi:hypothetical protein
MPPSYRPIIPQPEKLEPGMIIMKGPDWNRVHKHEFHYLLRDILTGRIIRPFITGVWYAEWKCEEKPFEGWYIFGPFSYDPNGIMEIQVVEEVPGPSLTHIRFTKDHLALKEGRFMPDHPYSILSAENIIASTHCGITLEDSLSEGTAFRCTADWKPEGA